MELSFASCPSLQSVPRAVSSDPRQAARPSLFSVPVPRDLEQFGRTVEATALGDPAKPPIVVLGGISADCYPAVRADGSLGWWHGLVGDKRGVDPDHSYVIGVSYAADETGGTAPSTHDQARVLEAALDRIGVDRPVTIIGASYGGMVGLALAHSHPQRVDRLVVVSAGADSHPQSTAARELQRRVVSLGLETGRGEEALEIARGMAMLTYRCPQEFRERFAGGIAGSETLSNSDPGAYLRSRGNAFRSVMSPQRFLSLSASIDRHVVPPEEIHARCLIIGAKSDQLVFPEDLRCMADRLSGPCKLCLLDSPFGHDMFLKEAERLGKIVAPFLAKR